MQVADLITLDKKFKDIQVIAGEKGLNRIIKDIEILEVPDGVYWIEEGDFAITTGYVFQDNQSFLYNIIEIMNSKKSSGLGIKTGRFIKKISSEIIELANNLNFPILEIPMHLGYSDFTWPIVSKLLDDKSYNTFVFEQFQNNLTSIVNQRFEIDNILHLLKSYIDMPIVLLSKHYKLIKCINNTSNVTSKLPIKDIIKTITDNIEHIKSMNTSFVYKSKKYDYYIFSIKSTKHLLGYLCIIDYNNKNCLSQLNTLLINEIIPYIVIWIMSDAQNNIHYISKEDLLLDLICGNYKNDADLKYEMECFQLNINTTNFLWIIDFKKAKSVCNSNKDTNIMAIYNFITKQFPDNMVLINNRSIICIHPISHETPILTHNDFMCLVDDFNNKFPQYQFKIGVSTQYKSLLDINYAYHEAQISIDLGDRISYLPSNVYFYKDLTAFHLVDEFASHPIMIKLYENTIQRLVNFDLKNKSELLKTLLTYMYCDFNIYKTAESLFLHRNTLYKRFEKIHEIIDYNLNNNEGKLILSLALKLYEIKNIKD